MDVALPFFNASVSLHQLTGPAGAAKLTVPVGTGRPCTPVTVAVIWVYSTSLTVLGLATAVSAGACSTRTVKVEVAGL